MQCLNGINEVIIVLKIWEKSIQKSAKKFELVKCVYKKKQKEK